MRTVHLILIAIVLQGIAFAGYAGSSSTASRAAASSTVEAAAPAGQLVCKKNEHVCWSCDGRFQYCAEFCPDCIPPLHDRGSTTPTEVASLDVRGEACADPI